MKSKYVISLPLLPQFMTRTSPNGTSRRSAASIGNEPIRPQSDWMNTYSLRADRYKFL